VKEEGSQVAAAGQVGGPDELAICVMSYPGYDGCLALKATNPFLQSISSLLRLAHRLS
jgi:hypothetical protein